MFASKSANAEAAKLQQQGCKRVREWLDKMLPEDERDEEDGGKAPPGKETNVIVNQLACKEAGCPDVECVLTLLRAKPRPKLMFKIYKAAIDLTKEEVAAAMQAALTEEQKEATAHNEHGHDEHGHDEHSHGHGEHDHAHTDAGHDCEHCGHDHGHAESSGGGDAEKGHSHEHEHHD
jgi:hypothetical protein